MAKSKKPKTLSESLRRVEADKQKSRADRDKAKAKRGGRDLPPGPRERARLAERKKNKAAPLKHVRIVRG